MSDSSFSLTLMSDPDPALWAKIMNPLAAHNEAAVGSGNWLGLAVIVRDAEDQVVGGLWGRTGYGFLFVELLALGAAKGLGLGRQVMAMAEAEARRRGAVGIYLDTFSFQAPEFYDKLGFTEFGRIPDFPRGHARIFYSKRLV